MYHITNVKATETIDIQEELIMKNGEYLLSTEKVGRAFCKLALPALLTTLISQIYNLTDTYFIGLVRDTAMLSAVSMAMPVMWLVSALCGMIGAGAPQLISLKMGACDSEGAQRCRAFCVFGTIVLSAVVSPIAYVLIEPVLSLMGAEGALLAHAVDYLEIIIATGGITAVSGAIQGVLRAGGRTRQASIASAVGIVVNIALDPIFILTFGMNMRGAAIATALGSLASLIVSIVYARDEISVKHVLPKAADIGAMFKMSLASTCSSVITSLTVGASFTMATSFGGNAVASISVCSKIYSVVVSVVSSLAFSMQPFIGYNFAANNHKRLLKGIWTSLAIGSGVCLAGVVAFALGGRLFMRCFTDDAELISYGAQMLKYLSVGLPVAALQMNAMSYLNGTGKALRTLVIALARQLVVFVPMMLIMQHFMGMTGLMLAYPLTDVIATIPAVLFCVGDIKALYAKRLA